MSAECSLVSQNTCLEIRLSRKQTHTQGNRWLSLSLPKFVTKVFPSHPRPLDPTHFILALKVSICREIPEVTASYLGREIPTFLAWVSWGQLIPPRSLHHGTTYRLQILRDKGATLQTKRSKISTYPVRESINNKDLASVCSMKGAPSIWETEHTLQGALTKTLTATPQTGLHVWIPQVLLVCTVKGKF